MVGQAFILWAHGKIDQPMRILTCAGKAVFTTPITAGFVPNRGRA
jgi:hypothetical protein